MNLRKIIKESIDDFDWIKSSFDKLHPGTKYKTPSGNIVTITKIEDGYVWWSVYDVSVKKTYFHQGGHLINLIYELIDEGSWVLHSLPNE